MKNPIRNSSISQLFTTFATMNRFIVIILSLLAFISANAQNSNVQCEDTCSHIHGIDLSHYQGNVFWEIIGDNTKMAYVYLKATEGGDNRDDKYVRNIQLENFMTQCLPGDQDLIPMIDIETTSGLRTDEFCDSLFKFIDLVEKAYKQKPLLYTFTNFYNRYLIGKINDYKLMIAQYTQREPVLRDGRDFEMWQYTGKGQINGINGYVDKSRFMGNHKLREIRFRHR